MGHLLVVFATSWRNSTERNLRPGAVHTTWTIVTRRGLQTWFMWDIYEWYLPFHCGAVLRGHLDYGSMSYDLGLCGTSMSGICYFMAEQY